MLLSVRFAVLLLLVGLSVAPLSAQRAELAKARSLYNERQFDARHRGGAMRPRRRRPPRTPPPSCWPGPISSAIASGPTRTICPRPASPLAPCASPTSIVRDNVDFLMALGEALFFEDDYGAAATAVRKRHRWRHRAGPADRRGDARLVGQCRRASRRCPRARRADGGVPPDARPDDRASCRGNPGSAAAALLGCGRDARRRRAGRGLGCGDRRLGPRPAGRRRARRRCAPTSTS